MREAAAGLGSLSAREHGFGRKAAGQTAGRRLKQSEQHGRRVSREVNMHFLESWRWQTTYCNVEEMVGGQASISMRSPGRRLF